jgi:hypothetical protein
MRFLIGCILGLAVLAPLAVVVARAVAVPTPPTNLVVASADARECTPYYGPFGHYGNPWCQTSRERALEAAWPTADVPRQTDEREPPIKR